MNTLFISDLHLDASRPAVTDAFLNFLQTTATEADTLYILGDLFEVWYGDDHGDAHYTRVTEALAELASSGTRCFFMVGNRDFIIGRDFLAASGLMLLPDPTLIYVGNDSVLLSHGDMLCTDDLAYQRFRRIIRNPYLQALYNALPRSARHGIANKMRSESSAAYEQKGPEIMDVNQHAVELLLRDFKVHTLLHGHTHRPGINNFELDGKPARRIVLGDWYEQGSVLGWDENGLQLETLNFGA